MNTLINKPPEPWPGPWPESWPEPWFDGLDPEAARSSDGWNQIYLMSALMHPAQTDEMDPSHLSGFEGGLVWTLAFPMLLNTQGLSLREVAFRMLTDIEADALALELGMNPAFEEGLADVIRSAMDQDANSFIGDPITNMGLREVLPGRMDVGGFRVRLWPLAFSAGPDAPVPGGSREWCTRV